MRMGLIAVSCFAIAGPALAEVQDAVYRGTMVCDKLPFTHSAMREAFEVTIADGKVSYKHVVRLQALAESTVEQGTGIIEGQDITLIGGWDGGNYRYKASYRGTFVRRSARLKGKQIWASGGKDVTRACAGSIKRPFKVFLPRKQAR
jgi:hypothetical protein